jgi:hypothetical protein
MSASIDEIEDAVIRSVAQRKKDLEERGGPPDPPAQNSKRRFGGGRVDPPAGVHQTKRMAPPKPEPGMLNKEMADAAAAKYKKDQKKIQKACAEVDGTGPAEQRCTCIIL